LENNSKQMMISDQIIDFGRCKIGQLKNTGWSIAMKRTTLVAVAAIASLGIVGSAHAAGDVQAGMARAAACAACHGANGQGVAPNPPLAGKKEDQIIQALKEFKSGKRDSAVMKGMASSLSDQDMANLAAYFASLK
jgi:cytochrome c553